MMRHLSFKKNDILITGPFVGEFGWELMEWQGYIRKLSFKYKKTISISYNSSDYLYENCLFFGHDFRIDNSKFGYGEIGNSLREEIIYNAREKYNISKCDVFLPDDLVRINKILIGKQKFIKFYERPILKDKIDLVFHFRNFKRYDGDNKNLLPERADKLISYFISLGFVCASIGYPGLSYCPPNSIDLRTVDLKQTISVIANSRLVIGGSSGPMHLACLCGKPVVTWIAPPNNADRYKTYWNPFKVNTYIVSEKTFNPEINVIIEKVLEALKSE